MFRMFTFGGLANQMVVVTRLECWVLCSVVDAVCSRARTLPWLVASTRSMSASLITPRILLSPFAVRAGWQQLLDKLHMDDRHAEKPLRVPVLDRYTDRGTMALGKVEQVCTLKSASKQAGCLSKLGPLEVMLPILVYATRTCRAPRAS